MKVGIYSQWFPPEPGPAAAVGALACELAKKGHEVKVLTGFPILPDGVLHREFVPGPKSFSVELGAQVLRTYEFPSHNRSVVGRILNYFSFVVSSWIWGRKWFEDCDVVWVYYSPVTLGWIVPYLQKQRVGNILHVMDIWPDNIGSAQFVRNSFFRKVIYFLVEKWNSRVYGRADRILVLSRGAIQVLKERGAPEGRLEYFPLWSHRDEPESQGPENLRERYGVSEKTTLIVYAGTIGKTQALDRLVAAVRLARENDIDIACWIVGSGTEKERIATLAKACRLDSRIFRLFDSVPTSHVAAFYRASDVQYIGLRADDNANVTMPSKFQTSLMHGKPLLVDAGGELAWTVIENGVGRVLENDSYESAFLEAVVLGRDGWAALGKRARKLYIEEYSLDAAVKNFVELGTAVVSERSVKRSRP